MFAQKSADLNSSNYIRKQKKENGVKKRKVTWMLGSRSGEQRLWNHECSGSEGESKGGNIYIKKKNRERGILFDYGVLK